MNLALVKVPTEDPQDEVHSLRGLSDETLMGRFAENDVRSFDILFERYRDRIYNYFGRIADYGVAEDLTQATFLSMMRARNSFHRQARFRPWLYTIASNLGRDHLRRERRMKVLKEHGVLAALVSTDASAQHPIHRDSGIERLVARALKSLPDRQRIPVVMHCLEGLSFCEIGDALDLSEVVVKARAKRGYRRLREFLRSLWEDL